MTNDVSPEALAGYCWPQSVLPGETVTLHCHCEAAAYAVKIVREGASARTVFESTTMQGSVQAMPDDLASRGCGWDPSLDIVVDPAWPSGMYVVRLEDEDGNSAEAFFVVRTSEPADALLVLSTTTWSAYNDWGGPSFYVGGRMSSAQRPLPRGFLHKEDPERYRVARFRSLSAEERVAVRRRYSPWCVTAGWANWEWLFVRWAESQGWRLGYATSSDLDRDPGLLDGWPAYVSVGHDEYWSAGMRDAVESYVDAGGNAAFFSGNTAFWQVRFEDGYSRIVGYKNAIRDDPVFDPAGAPTLSTMWSDPLVGRPENEMTGVSFTRGGYAHIANSPRGTGGYTVWRPDHWAFDSLPLRAGDVLGAAGTVVGYECDGCELELRDGLPFATGRDGTPRDFSVLATAPAHLWETSEAVGGMDDSYIGELNWVAERIGGADTPENRLRFAHGRAVLGAFRRGRGEVFTTGCTDWAYGLPHNDVATVTTNVLERFVHGHGRVAGSS